MAWAGEKIRTLAKENGLSLVALSELLNVSRQTINDWIKGQVPKGHHLIQLCSVLETSPEYFFTDEVSQNISMPLHRKRGVAKITETVRNESYDTARLYETLFKNAVDPGLVPVLRADHKDENAQAMAKKLRKWSGIEHGTPMSFDSTFNLLNSLNIVTIFRHFSDSRTYAFFCRIHKYRVVFVNNHTNVLDLIFPLLHEAIHAIRDEGGKLLDDPQEEKFCDLVANYVQFPNDYVETVVKTIEGRKAAMQVSLLKQFSKANSHSLFGIVAQVARSMPDFRLKIGGADTYLKKQFPTVGDVLFKSKNPRDYVEKLGSLSPLFLKIVLDQMDNVTTRRIAEWFDLDNVLDGRQVVEELRRIKSDRDD